MRCQRCGKTISPLRQLTDSRFCSEEHRRRGPRASAAALRDYEQDGTPLWAQAREAGPKPAHRAGAPLGVFLLVTAGLLFAARAWMPEVSSGGSRVSQAHFPRAPEAGARATARQPEGLLDWVEDRLPGGRPLRLRTDFRDGLEQWSGAAVARRAGEPWHPNRLRLWQPTMGKVDYDLVFLGQIDRRAIGWTFRATGAEDYYAAKILLSRPGQMSGASIQRLVVLGSRVLVRSELPLPLILQQERPYRFTVSVQGNRFTTFIDGHVIDEWFDSRLKRGGVGFLADEGEASSIHWADFRERKGWLGRFLATALFPPPELQP